MRVYEIFIPETGKYVKFKALEPERAEDFLIEASDLNRDDYVKRVLDNIVYNMKTEVVESLKQMTREAAATTIDALFNCCVMLNPGLDIDTWVRLAYSVQGSKEDNDIFGMEEHMPTQESAPKKATSKKLSKAKFLGLDKYLKDRVVGQDEAVGAVVNALKRSQAGLNDEQRPLGVFLFAGSSGVGKTHLARELHKYMFGESYDMIRIDCGEYQHKHENQKLLGSPPGYVGHDEGGMLTNQIEEHPDTVVLLDEVEKAHPDMFNTFLRVFDEGIITNNKGEQVSFRNAIIIMTTNLGNDKIVESLTSGGVGFGSRLDMAHSITATPARTMVERLASDAIKKNFRPEFLNRIDQTIVFNHLTKDDFGLIAEMELQTVDDKLSKKGNSLRYDDSVVEALIATGVDTVRGARGMAQVRRDQIENKLADLLLSGRFPRGTIFEITYRADNFEFNTRKPTKVVETK